MPKTFDDFLRNEEEEEGTEPPVAPPEPKPSTIQDLAGELVHVTHDLISDRVELRAAKEEHEKASAALQEADAKLKSTLRRFADLVKLIAAEAQS